MANRTIQFMGQAYSSNPVSNPVIITATLAGNILYSGPVSTLPDPGVPYPRTAEPYVLFQVTTDQLPTTFAGNLSMSCTMSGGGVYWGEILANYYSSPTDTYRGTVDHFRTCYFGIPSNLQNDHDPRSNVRINGIQQVPGYTGGPTFAVWCWQTLDGDVFEYDLNVSQGQVGNTTP